jgi:hypothetical protein
MAEELSALPESFPAGTTVTYRRRFSDYPASEGWTLTLHLAGKNVRSIVAVADGDDFLVTIAASMTAPGFAAGFYRWAERVVNIAGEVKEVSSGVVTILANLAAATPGSLQEWLEQNIAILRDHIQNRLAAGLESYVVAGRQIGKISIREANVILASYESQLARLANPDVVTRQVLVRFTPPGENT